MGAKTLNRLVYNYMRDNCEFRQLIIEYDYSWIHVEYREGDNKKQELVVK